MQFPPSSDGSPVNPPLNPQQREQLSQLALAYVDMTGRRTPEFAARRIKEMFGVELTEAELRDTQARLLPEVLKSLADAVRRRS